VGILDLTGPAFLGVYVPMLAVAGLLALFVRSVLRPPSSSKIPTPQLTAAETAYLAGGSRQALAAVVTSLVQRKVVAVDASTRSIQVVGALPGTDNTIERQLLSIIGKNPRTVDSLESNAEGLFDSLRRRLSDRGLLVPDDKRWIPQLGVFLIAGPVLALGVAKLFIGVARGRPVGILILLLLIGAVATFKLLSDLPERSVVGDAALRALRRRNAGLEVASSTRPERVSPEDLALAVALFGPAVMSVGVMGDVARVLQPQPRVASNGGCSASSCGSSCGGGCGGGGCGGCGG
jgi:uncharacterized protein (TIGR04222 family)